MTKVVVLGSINQDLIAVCERHPRRGETVPGMGLLRVPGGKGLNQAIAAQKAGSAAVLIGAVGTDPFGSELIADMKARNVDTTYVRVDDVPTGTATIIVDTKGDISIVANAGANDKVADNTEVAAERGDVFLSQLEVPRQSIKDFFARARDNGVRTLLNATPISSSFDSELGSLTDICVVNECELAAISGIHETAFAFLPAVIDIARQVPLAAGGSVVVMLKGGGVVAINAHDHVIFETISTEIVDMTGVEDCFAGYLASGLCAGTSFNDSIRLAQRAAAVSATRRGASMPSRAELYAHG